MVTMPASDDDRDARPLGSEVAPPGDPASQGGEQGPADGVAGPKTRTAIRQYQQNNGLGIDGTPSPSLSEHIRARL